MIDQHLLVGHGYELGIRHPATSDQQTIGFILQQLAQMSIDAGLN